jgi:two-component system NtrC family sensor kinase
MRFDLPFSWRSLKAKLISHYLVILGIGGLATSVVGSYIVSSSITMLARRSVEQNLATARAICSQHVDALRLTVQLVSSGTTVPQGLASGHPEDLRAYLERIRQTMGFDFLALTDRKGHAVLRASNAGPAGDDVSSISVVRAALSGQVAAATEILPAAALGREDPRLPAVALTPVVAASGAQPSARPEDASGMVLIAAAPVRGAAGELLGVLYGGVLLNRNLAIVSRVWQLAFKGESSAGDDVGSVSIFQGDRRIATNVTMPSGERALGTLAPVEARNAVLRRGETWLGRVFVVREWDLAGYEPIRNYRGEIIGMLGVGRLERTYTAVRDRVILSFFGIATFGFIVIIGVTYYEISSITRPVALMVAATRSIAAGRFDHEVEAVSPGGEIALLAESFNTMLKSLRQMKGDLEEWGRTLEQKVKQRTEELGAMQARVAQSERLASLGMLAAGVAHEINNPLGGILALTALALEDLHPDDPNRENLEEVLRQSERCRDIVRGLLEFSHQSKISVGLVDLNRILHETLTLISSQSAFFNVNIVREWDPQLPAVMADKSQLEQVFMNMLVNSAHAMEERGTITIVTRRATDEDAVEVVISDTGCGIPPEDIHRIFDPFFSTKPSGQGTGLGLSIAYGVVTSHNGTITVDSKVGRGTSFTIRLPIASAEKKEPLP